MFGEVSKRYADLLLSVSLMCTDPVPAITSFLLQSAGNALLFGVGGSGRQSLTRLASFVSDYELFQIEISKGYGKNEWKDDLKSCLMRAGIDTKPIVFLFSDTQVCFRVCVGFPEQQFACLPSSFCAAACIVTAGFPPNSIAYLCIPLVSSSLLLQGCSVYATPADWLFVLLRPLLCRSSSRACSRT